MNLESKNVSRRGFLGASAAVAASVAALSATGCSSDTSLEKLDKYNIPTDPAADGKWVSNACWHNCGGRCMNKVMVKDGAVIRAKTDDTHEDTVEYPQQRGCVRGKAQQQQCFGADRILHPLKRKNWQPGGGENSHGDLRGKDEWETITWDEAIKLACEEIKRISDEYGPTGFFCKNPTPFINLACGCVRAWDSTSQGTYTLDCTLAGMTPLGKGGGNDRFDMPNAEYIVMWASNPTWSTAGTPINYFLEARNAGTKFISIDPLYNASAQMLEAEWIPIRNSTDLALMFATAYEMMRLDEEEGDIVDWDFLHKYTVGFDAETMPEDATIQENLKDYILGKYDETPKTPEWAEAICGVKPEAITNLARVLGKKNKTMILHNYAMARTTGTEMLPQMVIALGAMGGHIGKSGHATATAMHAQSGNAGPDLVVAGSTTLPETFNKIETGVRNANIYEIIANGGGHTQDVANAYGAFHAANPTELGPIKCIFHTNDANLQTSLNQKMGIEAHRTVDFVMTRAQFMNTQARYADIVLPVTTEWETVGGYAGAFNREFIALYSQVTEPLGEAKTDQEITKLLCEGYGIDPNLAYDKSEKQQFFEKIATSTVMGEKGEMVPLVTITAEDIKEWEVEGEPQTGVIGLQEIIDNGGYQFERHFNDGHGHIGFKDFIDDPKGHPLTSKSGKFEIYCQARYDLLMSMDFPGKENYKPYPTYVYAVSGYHTTFKDNKIGGEKGEFPYMMYNPHYLRRSHTVFDNCPWLREAWANPAFISRADAEEKGVKDGDTIMVSTRFGQSLRKAAVMDIMMPGVVALPHGCWVDVDEETGIDQAGSDNYLTGSVFDGMGASAYNSQNCNFEKYSGEEIPNDCDLPARWSSDIA